MHFELSISCSVSDNFAQHFAVLAASVMANNPDAHVRFHMLHRNVSDEHLGKIKEMETLYPGGDPVSGQVPDGISQGGRRSLRRGSAFQCAYNA